MATANGSGNPRRPKSETMPTITMLSAHTQEISFIQSIGSDDFIEVSKISVVIVSASDDELVTLRFGRLSMLSMIGARA